jgi:hypothetical protein
MTHLIILVAVELIYVISSTIPAVMVLMRVQLAQSYWCASRPKKDLPVFLAVRYRTQGVIHPHHPCIRLDTASSKYLACIQIS